MIGCLLGGCLEAQERACDEIVCPADRTCVEGRGCVEAPLLDACAGAAPFAACQAGGISDGTCVPAGPTAEPLLCVAAGCGNGVVEPDEVCDDGNRIDTDDCSADCRSDNTCGNGIADALEGCDCGTDPTNLPPGCPTVNDDGPSAICRRDCSAAGCGDGLVVAPEDCEPGAALAASCTDLGYYAGELACLPTCRFDVSACVGRCGDGVRQDGEACEASPLDVGALTCAAFGYYRGELGCNAACGIDLGGCEGTCGDGVREAPEDCELLADGVDLGGATCNDLGYYGGELGCNASCRFDAGACAGRCGDDVLDEAEQCDGAPPDFGCGDLGGVIDRPACSVGCSADARTCPTVRLTTAAPGGAGDGYGWIAPDDGSRWGVSSWQGVLRLDDSGETTWPLGDAFDLAVVSSTEVYAITCTGEVQAWDGTNWSQLRPAIDAGCYGDTAIAVLAGTVWAGRADSLERLTPAGWEAVPAPANSVTDLVVCDGELYVVDYSRGVDRFDDPGWISTTPFYGAWGGACDQAGGGLWLGGEIDGFNSVARLDLATMSVSLRSLPIFDTPYFPSVIAPNLVYFPGYFAADFVWTGRRVGTLSTRVYSSPGFYLRAQRAPEEGSICSSEVDACAAPTCSWCTTARPMRMRSGPGPSGRWWAPSSAWPARGSRTSRPAAGCGRPIRPRPT
ncbi:MAG: hypothetical protein R2939_13080 [Kofleriaceae bacterium]